MHATAGFNYYIPNEKHKKVFNYGNGLLNTLEILGKKMGIAEKGNSSSKEQILCLKLPFYLNISFCFLGASVTPRFQRPLLVIQSDP